ncbi:ribose 5-phosphate isomerase B [Faecalicatena contorta]|uniref:Ribose 5-phosphate isomerase B n=1 Tax=Faecalicatena contorta TaxID=39482 RepID=A0A315ZTE6_9FIRM|nr:ribose 5-phosphate isomerase B [Faecalicatena contorta]PWJ48579.1 ribose 5-phosphate isomerase B [Faecalicatena contorta]SUQ15315.1 ribose 5-phosphate isomerase B [Faecalicatena contorta]
MIAIGSDHGGFQLKKAIMKHLERKKIAYLDFGTYEEMSTDYPIYGKKVAEAILSKECERGIIICGTGIGISIMANRYKGIRAALCSDCFSAEATRLHNNANILALGTRVIGEGLALKIVDTFLETPFSNDERHIKRVSMLSDE